VTGKTLIVLAGLGQLGLALASLMLPRVLGWRADTAKLRPLTRNVFWTYAGYIWGTNVCFGLLSTLAPTLILERAPLARIVSGYITLYWGARVLLQFVYFDRSDAPPGVVYRFGEAALVALFLFLTAIYGWTTFS
jgi:hypothetical protein